MALIVAAALAVVLAMQNRALRADYAALRERTALPHPGLYVPTFQTTTAGGQPVTIGEAAESGRQLLFVFNTTCPYCRASLPAWNRIAASLDSAGEPAVAVYGISLDSAEETRRYVAEHGLTFPVVRFPQRKLSVLYRTGIVPQVLVLDQGGQVVYARAGVLEERAARDSVIAAATGVPEEVETGASVESEVGEVEASR